MLLPSASLFKVRVIPGGPVQIIQGNVFIFRSSDWSLNSICYLKSSLPCILVLTDSRDTPETITLPPTMLKEIDLLTKY